MIDKIKLKWVYILSIGFILLNAWLVMREQYLGFTIPIILLFLLLYIYYLDKVLLIIVFTTPFSVLYSDPDFNVGLALPTEPLLIGILIMLFLNLFKENYFDRKFLSHKVTLSIIFFLLWMFISSISSEIPVVSFKHLLSQLWFIIPFYFVVNKLFRDYHKIKTFIWLYTIPLIGVVFYTIYNHSLWNFQEAPGHWVMTPFYNDHTAYGALLAMFIPVLLGLTFGRYFNKTQKLYAFMAFMILAVAIFFSYCRAAWMSLGGALVLWLIIMLKIRFRTILITLLALVTLFMMFQQQIFMKMEKNKQSSSNNIVEHLQSISNVTSDASNKERINRWKSAIRMFQERPILGWGPGTYQFVYAPFQNSQERTIISTNAGDRGNSHSEYFGPLCESGLLGMLSFLAIIIFTSLSAFRVYKHAENKEIRYLSLILLLGLFTYFIHGIMNNFLDTDKAAIPFWGFVSAIVAMDIYAPKVESVPEPSNLPQ